MAPAGQAAREYYGRISRLVLASVRRLVDRFDDNPIAVHDAMWTLMSWSTMWAALMGDPSGLDDKDRNVVWRHFTHRPTRTVFTAVEQHDYGDLRIVVYTAQPGSEAASKLALLATIGTQPMAPVSAGTD